MKKMGGNRFINPERSKIMLGDSGARKLLGEVV